MQAGSVFGRPLQPYEAHIPFLLQFKVLRPSALWPASPCIMHPALHSSHEHLLWRRQLDFNLYGMGFVRFGCVKFRAPVPSHHHESARRQGWWHKPVVLRFEPETASGPTLAPASQPEAHCMTSILTTTFEHSGFCRLLSGIVAH